MLGFRQTSVHVFYFWFIRLHLPRRMNLFFIFPSAPRTQKRPPCPRALSRAAPNWAPPNTIAAIIARNRPHSPPRNPTKSPICADSESGERQLIQQTHHFIQRPSKSFVPPCPLPTFALSSRQQRNTNQKIEDNEKSGLMVKCTPERGQKCSLFHLMVKCTPIIVELPSVYRGCKPLICFQ